MTLGNGNENVCVAAEKQKKTTKKRQVLFLYREDLRPLPSNLPDMLRLLGQKGLCIKVRPAAVEVYSFGACLKSYILRTTIDHAYFSRRRTAPSGWGGAGGGGCHWGAGT